MSLVAMGDLLAMVRANADGLGVTPYLKHQQRERPVVDARGWVWTTRKLEDGLVVHATGPEEQRYYHLLERADLDVLETYTTHLVVDLANLECIEAVRTSLAAIGVLERLNPGADRVMHELDLAGRALLWGGGDKIVIVPQHIDPVLIEATAALTNASRLEVWHPARSSLRLSRDVLRDQDLLRRLREETEARRAFAIRPYAVTPEFCTLSEHLGWGSFGEACAAAADLDSKAGFRRAFEGSKAPIPEGVVCEDLSAAASAIHAFAAVGRRSVVKVHNGESGWGLRFLDQHRDHLTTPTACRSLLSSLADRDPVWATGPYVVEAFVAHDPGRPGSSPSGEAAVDKRGVQFGYLADQIVNAAGEFCGVCIGKDLEGYPHADELRRLTLLVGETLRAKSYTGSYDVDFIVADDEILAVESNVRLTGGTHVFDAARQLFGTGWSERTFVSNDHVTYGASAMPAAWILKRLDGLQFRRGSDRGVIVSFVSLRRPVLGLVAVGPTREDALGQIDAASQTLRTG